MTGRALSTALAKADAPKEGLTTIKTAVDTPKWAAVIVANAKWRIANHESQRLLPNL
jgi:hypothetical protein